MIGSQWLQPPRRALTIFVAVVVACVAALASLGYRLLQQDRALESQRVQEQLEVAADHVVASLGSGLERLQNVAVRDLAPGVVLVAADATAVEARGTPRLVFEPLAPAPAAPPPQAVLAGETLEFQRNDPLAAAARYREASRSRDAAVRAAALVRLGRSLRKAGRTREALDAYSELAALGEAPVAGLPSELVALEGRCSALEEAGDREGLRREATALLGDLEEGRWRLTRDAYEYRVNEARRWAGEPAGAREPSEAMALSEAVESLVRAWRDHPEDSGGRRLFGTGPLTAVAVWRATPARLAATVAGPRHLRRLWADALGDPRMRLALTGADGQALFGTPPAASARMAVRAAATTALPWTVHVSAADAAGLASGLSARRRLLLGGLSILAVLLVVSSGFVVRSVTRELAVSRMQSEFVASVSHEFRSPLTSIRQLTSMLVEGRLPSEEQRRRSYAFLADETGRLERLVEGLLDFGLAEAGRARYRLEPADAADLVRETVAAFRPTVASRGYDVEVSLPGGRCPILADTDALGRAVWNLLDNAVKYSPGTRTVWVDVARRDARVAITVRDAGMGIPAEERDAIFQKFVRGANTKKAGIKGTGIGLAMVKHIVAAHGGEVGLASAPGKGSEFTIELPLEGRA